MNNYGYDTAKLQKQLPLDERFEKNSDGEYDFIKVPHDSIISEDGALIVSGESGSFAIDYYGEFRGGYPYISDELEQWAEKQGFNWEWQNPGAIILC